jgi:hypothetical protein
MIISLKAAQQPARGGHNTVKYYSTKPWESYMNALRPLDGAEGLPEESGKKQGSLNVKFILRESSWVKCEE